MSDLSAYRFATTHEWVKQDGSSWLVGISDHAQEELGDVIFVELPAVGAVLTQGQRFGVIELVKAASDLYAPVAGKVAEVNAALADTPEVVNSSPYEGGWMLRLEDVDDSGASLLDAAAYEAQAGG